MQEQIRDALRRGDAAQALAVAQDAIAAQPQDPMLHRLLAAARHLSGDLTAALAAIEAALELAPDDPGLHVERAGLLLGARQLGEADAALARAVGLDPNQFAAYAIQGQLALGRGDIDEAERLARTAGRIAPSHPHVAAIEGMVALRRGDADSALSILSQAAQRAPEEAVVRNALGFAYMAKGHFAFAEQSFRALLEKQPESLQLRGLIADLVRRQGRPGDAADELAPLLEREDIPPGLRRVAGELQLQAGRADQAVTALKAALAAMPGDRRTLEALLEAWRRTNDLDDARATIEELLAAHPQSDNFWRARLLFEPYAGPEALAIVERWLAAKPDHIPALQSRAAIHDLAGEIDAADAIAHRIVELEPGHSQAELRIVDRLLQRDPPAAVARVQDLLTRAAPENQRLLRQLLARCLDVAGDVTAAATLWSTLHAEVADQRLPLPPLTTALGDLPPLAPLPQNAPGVLLLWGAPGSLVERIALTLEAAGGPLRADRFGGNPPADPLQRYATPQELLDGRLDGSFLVSQWRAMLPGRGIAPNGPVFDWLVTWDNALLHALRPHLPEAVLMVALRDPRDMLLEWMAFSAPQRFALTSPEAGARWLADALAQIAELHEGDLFPHRLIRLDDIVDDAAGVAAAVGQALETSLPAAASLGPPHLPAGHWRAYVQPLAEAFALLTPVAVRLGYPEH